MATQQTIIGTTYYELEVTWAGPDGGSTYVAFEIQNLDGSPNQAPSEDAVADGIRDWYASQANFGSSILRKRESSSTTL